MCWELVWTFIVYRLWIGQFEFNIIAKIDEILKKKIDNKDAARDDKRSIID